MIDKNGKVVTVVDKNGKTVPRLALQNGSAVEIAPNTYLSAGHIFFGPIQDSASNIYTLGTSTFYVNPSSVQNPPDPTQRSITGTNIITGYINPVPYKASTTSSTPVHDLVGFNAATPDNEPTGVVLFKTPSLAKMKQFFPTVNFEGYIASTNATTGVVSFGEDEHEGVAITSVSSNGTFQVNTPAPAGDSGSGIWGNDPKGQSYVLGTVLAGSASASLGNYLNQNEFDALFPYTKSTPSTNTHNLIVGSSGGGDLIRGSYQTTDILGEGNNNIYLAGGDGDTINPGSGTNNVVFGASAAGASDKGTTFVLGAGTNIIDGGNANDKLVLLADRLWSTYTGDPTASSVQASSDMIQLLGGFGNVPGDTFGGYTAPSPGSYSVNTNALASGQNSTNPADSLVGNYAYSVDYYEQKQSDNTVDLDIYVYAQDDSSQSAGDVWTGETIVKNYKPGDFGLTFLQSKDYENFVDGNITDAQFYADYQQLNSKFIANPITSSYINDDPSVSWKGLYQSISTSPTSPVLTGDLHKVVSGTNAGTITS